ncbi:hypothetical protein B0H14DRAFT_2846828, partial [Mycena olivaceomarginata]
QRRRRSKGLGWCGGVRRGGHCELGLCVKRKNLWWRYGRIRACTQSAPATGGSPFYSFLFLLLSCASRCHDRDLVYREAILPQTLETLAGFIWLLFLRPVAHHILVSLVLRREDPATWHSERNFLPSEGRNRAYEAGGACILHCSIFGLAVPYSFFSVLDVSSFLFFGSPFSLSVFPFRPSPSPSESY